MKTTENHHSLKLIHSFYKRLVRQFGRFRHQRNSHNFQICTSTSRTCGISLCSLISAALIAFSLNTFAQQIIATSGGYFEGENISMSWTLGEPVIETFAGEDIILTQGFQQPYNIYLSQVLNIPAGWSGVSGYIDPVNKGVEAIFDDYIPDFIILASMSGFYYPAVGVNTIVDWDYQTGYTIKAANDFNVTLTGTRIDPPMVNLAAGWNLLPVLTSCGATTAEVFGGMSTVQIVKEVAGPNVYWPLFGIGTLETLQAGKAYFVLMTADDSVTYPSCSKSTPLANQTQKPLNLTPWNDLNYTSASHTIAFPSRVLIASAIQQGDYIGAFTPNGLCAGRTQITDVSSNVAVVAFSTDGTTGEVEGFMPGQTLQFRVFRPGTNEEMQMELEFDPSMPNMGIFENHGLSAAKNIILNPLSTFEISKNISAVYPNPSHGKFSLSMSTWPANLHIILMDMQGQTLDSFNPGEMPDGTAYQFNMQQLPKGIYILKLIYNNTSDNKKIIIH